MTKRRGAKTIGAGLAGLALVGGVALAWTLLGGGHDAPVMPGRPKAHETEDGHGHERGGKSEAPHAETAIVEISPEAMALAGLRVAPLVPQVRPALILAPGEVVTNRFGSGVVTPPTTGTVVERRAALGDRVRKGQVLAVLFSPEMAEALSQFRVVDQEWRRVRDLGREIVSDRRFNEAQAARQQALTRLVGFGVAPSRLDAVAGREDAAAGHVPLVAPRDGVVGSDAFDVGELVGPGRPLFTIVDERVAWIEARVSPAQAQGLRVGQPAIVRVGGAPISAVLRSVQPAVDPVTRTVALRFDAENPDGRLRAGLFVEVEIPAGDGAPVLALPLESVLRGPDGDWQVFVAEGPGRFRPTEVKVVRADATVAVVEGLAPGTPVVVAGAFFVQSEAAKSGFDPHNH